MRLRCQNCLWPLKWKITRPDEISTIVTVEEGGRVIRFCDPYCLMDYRAQRKQKEQRRFLLYEYR